MLKLWPIVKKEKMLIGTLLVLLALNAVLPTVISLFLMQGVLWVLSDSVAKSLLWAICFVLAYALNYLCQYYFDITQCKMTESIGVEIKAKLFENILMSNERYSVHSGEELTQITYDAEKVAGFYPQYVSAFIKSILVVAFSFAFCMFLSPVLTGTLMIVLVPSILVTKYYSSKVRNAYQRVSIAEANVRAFIQERLNNIVTVKSLQIEEITCDNAIQLNETKQKNSIALSLERCKMFCLSNFLGYVPIMLMLGLGAWMVSEGNLTIDRLVAFLMLSQSGIVWPISDVPENWAEISVCKGAFHRIEDIYFQSFPKKEKISDTEKSRDVHIQIQDLCFEYNHGTPVLEHLNIEIPSRQIICIKGPSGGGKSTLLKLIAGILDIQHGRIIFFPPNPQIAYVPQGYSLFASTVRENISFGKNDASFDEVIKAAQKAYAHDFIMTLPNGYDTFLSSDTIQLSEGQAQRIAIARAIISNSQLLLMDEPSSALDKDSEDKIAAAIAEYGKQATCIFVTHRSGLQSVANRVITIDGKRIAGDIGHER